MSSAAQTYARNSQTTATPREIEAQALLKAARQLQDVVENWSGAGSRLNSAIMFNRKLWSIFMSDAVNDENRLAAEIARTSPISVSS